MAAPNVEGTSNPASLGTGTAGFNLVGSSANSTLGFGTGAGGAVTQATSKATGVTLNTPTGQITLHNANLATLTAVSFTLTNSTIAAKDVIVFSIGGGVTTGGSYYVVATPAAGSAVVSLVNLTAGTLGEAVVLNYAVIKGSSN